MAVLVFAIVMVVGVLLLLLLGASRLESSQFLAVGTAWFGGLLVLASFVILVWTKPGPAGTFDENADWLIGQTKIVEVLDQIPEVGKKLDIGRFTSATALREWLDTESTFQFLRSVETGRPLHGWQLWGMCWRTAPILTIGLTLGMLSGLISTVLALIALITGDIVGRFVSIASASIAAASLIILLGRIAFLDSLGVHEDFGIRLIAALGEVQVATGAWWMALGLLFIVCSGGAYLLVGGFASKEDDDSDVDCSFLELGA